MIRRKTPDHAAGRLYRRLLDACYALYANEDGEQVGASHEEELLNDADTFGNFLGVYKDDDGEYIITRPRFPDPGHVGHQRAYINWANLLTGDNDVDLLFEDEEEAS